MNDDHDDQRPLGYTGAARRAERVVDDPERTDAIADRAERRADRKRNDWRLRHVWDGVKTLLRLVRAWRSRQYRETPKRTIVAALAGLLYLANPFDLLPDFIPFLGMIDDAAVVAFVLRSIAKDLTRFREWEDDRKSTEPATSKDDT